MYYVFELILILMKICVSKNELTAVKFRAEGRYPFNGHI